jgi:hypothetical protein
MFTTKNISESHVVIFLKDKKKYKDKDKESKKKMNVSFEKSL